MEYSGRERYEDVMAKTMAAKPAYDLYDEANALLAEKKTSEVIAKADKAIEIFPEEANFYALRGDARFLDDDFDKAVTNYDSAIRRRDDYFYYYLQRGRANEKLLPSRIRSTS